MKINKYIILLLAFSFLSVSSPLGANAQDELPAESVVEEQSAEVVIPPLFEYPVAPDELPDLESKVNYLMEHFWDPMDFKAKSVDQNALNHAFGVYSQAMPYASRNKVFEGVKKLIGKIKGNPGLTYQFTKAAEENMFGPRADVWIDDIYIMFLDNLAANKKIDNLRKMRYEEQRQILKATAIGAKMPQLKFQNRYGSVSEFKPAKDLTLLEFGNPECDDCRYTKLKLEISSDINDLMHDGKLDIAFIIPDDEDGELLELTQSYPDSWIVGSAVEDTAENFDIRATPCIYILDKEGKIIAKNVDIETAVLILTEHSK